MPFAEYKNFQDCLNKNKDKEDPEAYCGEIKKRTEDVISPECLIKAFTFYSQKYPSKDKKELLDMSFQHFKKGTTDFTNEDMIVNITRKEFNELMEAIQESGMYYRPKLQRLLQKMHKEMQYPWYVEGEEKLIEMTDSEEQEKEQLKGIAFSFHDIYGDIVATTNEAREKFSEDIDNLAENITFEDLVNFIHDTFIEDLEEETFGDLVSEEYEAKLDKLIENHDINGFIDLLTDSLFKIGDSETEEWRDAVRSELNASRTQTRGRGKGWYGEPERHSKARKTGKADLVGDIEDKLSERQLERLSLQCEKIILNSEFDEDLSEKLPLNSYIYHGTSVPLGSLESNSLTSKESIDEEGAIFFTVNLKEALAYGSSIIAIPINSLSQYKILRNIHGNDQELTTLMIEEDVELSENTLIYSKGKWYDKNSYLNLHMDEDDPFYESLEVSKEIQNITKNLNNNERGEWNNLKLSSEKKILQLKKQLKIIKNKEIDNELEESLLLLINKEEKNVIEKGKGWWGESERHSKARKEGHADTLDFILYDIALHLEDTIHDFLTTDAEATHLQEQFELLKQLEASASTPEAQALREALGGTFKPTVEGITVPFEAINTETGTRVRGSVAQNLQRNTKELTPVSSSNVRGVGQFNNELLVQFHGDDRVARRTYRYTMQSPEMAEEAYSSLLNSGSPGRWVWENIRGHSKGEPVTKNKLAPSLSPPGQGNKTIGGTSASLLPYGISNRTPSNRVQGFEKMAQTLQRETPNPSTNPNTGSRIEGTLAGRRQARDRGVNQLGVARKVRQLPKLDFTLSYIKPLDIKEDKEGIDTDFVGIKEAKKLNFTIKEVDESIVYDLIPLQEFTFKTNDLHTDFTILEGPITRAGPFPYKLGGYDVMLYKQWDNIKDVFSKVDYLPLIGSKDLGAHYAETLGFAYNFTFDNNKERVYADIITFEDMNKLSDNYNPSMKGMEGWEVSIGFKDHRLGEKQIIDSIDHLAVSLRNKEMGRCRAGGDPCYIKYKDQNLTEVVSHSRN